MRPTRSSRPKPSDAARLDWSDRAAVRRWVSDMRVVADDLDTVIADMLRPHRRRDFGPRAHREKCREARKAIVELLTYATPPDDGGSAPTR